MTQHFARALEEVNKSILGIGALVEEALDKAIHALILRRADLAQEVIDGDDVIDLREVEVEEQCLQVLALHQPVAHDLRFIVSALKVNSDLERIGDLAADIAERALALSKDEPLPESIDFTGMASAVRAMVRDALDALVHRDAALARRVSAQDDEVDRLNYEQRLLLTRIMRSDSSNIERALLTMFASRHLERVADHSVNIAEDVVYMVEGEVIRHAR
jgi:phosphate transport system protein